MAMTLNKVLNSERELIQLDGQTNKFLNEETKKIINALNKEIASMKIVAEVFIGGSFAKGTLLKKGEYDIDVYVRFDRKLKDISVNLEKVVNNVGKEINILFKKVHGSRDYFRLEKRNNLTFEIIPVCKIRKPEEARNVTDLSYFHVHYVKRKLKNNGVRDEILLAKKFCLAQRIYGAEDYIRGFSGYGLECLVIHYKTFSKMLRELVKVDDRLVIDSEKLYKNKNDVLFSLNESKLQSPVILVDPTWKERNALSALSRESFKKFQESARRFLDKPTGRFFEVKELDIDKLKKIRGEFIHLKFRTDRQEGDIAGTKMKKFSRYLEGELRKYFDIVRNVFVYSSGQNSDFYLVVKPKKEVVKLGPPVKMVEHVKAFKKKNKNFFVKGKFLCSKELVNFSANSFLRRFFKDRERKLEEMGIVGVEIR
jgi:tRNA nucleotidyltransferase (CCA-adding enzyme)